MKIRTDFVTNSSSSSYITIIATKKDGTFVKDSLESDGFPDKQIFFSKGIKKIVGSTTNSGEDILKNIQKMYKNPRIDYLLDESGDEHPLRCIESIKELLKIEIIEEVDGDHLDCVACEDDSGESVYPHLASVSVTYNVEENTYSKMNYSAIDLEGNALDVIFVEK